MLITHNVRMAAHLPLSRKPTKLHMPAPQNWALRAGVLVRVAHGALLRYTDLCSTAPTKLVIKLFSKLGCVCSKLRDFKDVIGVPSEQAFYQSGCRLPGAASLSRWVQTASDSLTNCREARTWVLHLGEEELCWKAHKHRYILGYVAPGVPA